MTATDFSVQPQDMGPVERKLSKSWRVILIFVAGWVGAVYFKDVAAMDWLWARNAKLEHVENVVVPRLQKAIPTGTSAKHETARTESGCIPIHPEAQ